MNELIMKEKHKETMQGLRTFITLFFEWVYEQVADDFLEDAFLAEYLSIQQKHLSEMEAEVDSLATHTSGCSIPMWSRRPKRSMCI